MDTMLLRRRAITPKLFEASGALPLSFNGRRMPIKSLVREGNVEQRNLPSGFTQLEYIEGTGTQYIDAGVSGPARWVGEAECTQVVSKSQCLLGALYYPSGSSTPTAYVYLASQVGSSSKYWQLCGAVTSPTITTVSRVAFDVTFGESSCNGTFNGMSVSRSYSFPNFTSWSIGIAFGGQGTYPFYGYIYPLKAYQNDVLVRDFVPAKRDIDNVIGMYDKVSGTFFTNAGTGSFTAGPNAVPTPDKPMDIVCNNGKLFYGDDEVPAAYKRLLGLTYNNNVFYEITDFKLYGSDTLRFSFQTPVNGAACNVLGAFDGGSAQSNYSLYIGTNSIGARYLRYNGSAYSSLVVLGKRYDVVITPTGSSGMEVDSTWTAKTFTSGVNFHIGVTSSGATSAKMIGDIIGNVVVDGRGKFIPCERVSDGVLGYYNAITGIFYEPTGTGVVSMGYDTSHIALRVVGTPETISLINGNLWDESQVTWTHGVLAESNGQPSSSEISHYSSAVPVIPGKTYTLSLIDSAQDNQNYKRVHGYGTANLDSWDSQLCVSHTESRLTQDTRVDVTFTVPVGVNYIRLSIGNLDYDIQLEEGTIATPYQPYVTPQSAIVENLFVVGNYKDTHDVISGQVARNACVLVCDGTEEGWGDSTTSGIYYLPLWNGASYTGRTPCVCTHFVGTDAANANMPDNTIKFANSSIRGGGVWIKHNASANLAAFKSFLAAQYAAGTPVIIIYPLATPTTESVTPQPLNACAGTNIVGTQSNVATNNATVKYYK